MRLSDGLAAGLAEEAGGLRRALGVDEATRRLPAGGVLPLWLGAGLADWYLHRRTMP